MKRLIAFITAFIICFGYVIPEQKISANTDVETLINAVENTQNSNHRVTGNVKISTPIDISGTMDLRLITTIIKVGESLSQSYRFNAHMEERGDTLDMQGSVKLLSNGSGETYVRLGSLHADSTDEDATEVISQIVDTLNQTVANTYVKIDFLDELYGLANLVQEDYMNGISDMAMSNLELMEIFKKFLSIANDRILTIKRSNDRYTIRFAKSISKEDAEAFAKDFYDFLKNDLQIIDITGLDRDEMIETAYDGLNDSLKDMNENMSFLLQIYTSENKISRLRFSLRSSGADFPVTFIGNFRYLERTPKKLSMPRCFIDMIDLLDILQAIDFDAMEKDKTYLQRRFKELISETNCR